ncbi:unnamed protein product [Calypogeia fissa]
MKALYNTEGFLRRNVLQVRQKSMEGTTSKNTNEPSGLATPTSERADLPSMPQPEKGPEKAKLTAAKPPTIHSTKHPTKKDTLHQAGEDLASMLSVVTTIKEKQASEGASKRVLEEAKASYAEAKQEESTAKCQESQSRKVYQDRQNILAEIAILEKQKELGLITEEKFKENCQVVFER